MATDEKNLSDPAVLKEVILSTFPKIKEDDILSVIPKENVCMKNGKPYGYEMTMKESTPFASVRDLMSHCQLVTVYRFPNVEKSEDGDRVTTLGKGFFQKKQKDIHVLGGENGKSIVDGWSYDSSVVFTDDNLLFVRGTPMSKSGGFSMIDGTLGEQVLDHRSKYWETRQYVDAMVRPIHDNVAKSYGAVFGIKGEQLPCQFMFNTMHGAASMSNPQNGACKIFVGGSCSRHDLKGSPVNNKMDHYVYVNAFDGYRKKEYPSNIMLLTEFIPADTGIKTTETYRDVTTKLGLTNKFHHEMTVTPCNSVDHPTMYGHVTDSDDSSVPLKHFLEMYEKSPDDTVIPVRTSSSIPSMIVAQYTKKFSNRSFASLWKPVEDNRYVGIEKAVLVKLIAP